ncbi:DUF2946 family protein [Acidovorax lacteus]|uniref:DUF2946 family protein n=1 Tax=Acidovorax lacteus TaxID=1924988 RepID=A0ABP8LD09_9BURK
MDDIVKQALAKWPNVPACYGWLGLDVRGRWYLRDDATQALGPFAHSRGTLLAHEKLIAFIHRNYEPDAQGCWFFQNGPQRVYVELEATPHIWRLQPDGGVQSHTGQPAQVRSAWLDEAGHFYLDTDIGFGLVHSADMAAVADAVEQGRWTPQEMAGSDLPARFGFVRSPQALQAVRGPA